MDTTHSQFSATAASEQEDDDRVQRFLRGELTFPPMTPSFQIWKTIPLGLFADADAYRAPLQKANCSIGPWADDVLNDVPMSDVGVVNLVVVSVRELGFDECPHLIDIYTKGKELGLDLCPAEVGPMLRLQYLDQPNGQWLHIAMDPLSDEDDELNIFVISNDVGDLWLCTAPGDNNVFMSPDCRFVFLLKK